MVLKLKNSNYMMFPNVWFCLADTPATKNIQFTAAKNKRQEHSSQLKG